MKQVPVVSLLLAIAHTSAGLLILIFSSWFIAACALMPVNFNYMLPAVIIRALALVRIGAGYGHMWLAHHDLLGRTTVLRSELFSKLKDHVLHEKAGDVEKLAAQTELLSSVWVGWVAHQASAVVLVILATGIVTQLALPGTLAMWVMAGLWLVLTLWLVVYGLNQSAKQTVEDKRFRFGSEHFFNSSSLWHLSVNRRNPHFASAPGLDKVWRYQFATDVAGQWALWLLHGCAILALVALFAFNQDKGFGDPASLIVPMLLLSITDWLGRSVATAAHLGRYRQAKNALGQSGAIALPAIHDAQPRGQIQLESFQALNVLSGIEATLPVKGLVVLSGPSGCGKSSLLKALAGLVQAKGDLRFDGDIVPAGRRKGWVYAEQSPVLLEATLRMNLVPDESVHSDRALNNALSQFGLGHFSQLDEWLGQGGRALSGGEARRVSLSRTLLASPKVWLVDEPFEGLDTGNQQYVAAGLTAAAENALVIIATHVTPEDIRRCADQWIEM